MPDQTDLAALLGSRICHDLIGPIGAIGNGVELLMMDGVAGSGPEMALINESLRNATARIRFFRLAFGAAGTGEVRIARSEVQSILSDLTAGGRLAIDWQSPADLARGEVKLACLLILCLETAMAYGGRIAVARGEDGWTLAGSASKLRVDPALWQGLTAAAEPSAIGPGQIQFLLAPDEARRQNRRLDCEITEGEIRLSF